MMCSGKKLFVNVIYGYNFLYTRNLFDNIVFST